MSKRSVVLVGTGLLVLVILSSQIPAINSRLAWRYQVAKTYAKNVINPIGDVPTAVPNPTSTKASASQTEVPSATHAVTETAMSPTATPPPIPVQALLDSPPYEQQTPNNCGLYCGACPIMLNTKTGAGTEQCYGCKSEQPTGYCAVCGIKACARGKGYEFCNECSEYSTRELMQKFPKDSNWPYQ